MLKNSIGKHRRAGAMKNNAYFSVGKNNELKFTEQGIEEYRSYFGKAGIDIRTIKTLEDFRRARRAAAPYFEERLKAKVKKGEPTLERLMLMAIAEGNGEEATRLERILDAKAKGITAV
jgi:hypothetical protein